MDNNEEYFERIKVIINEAENMLEPTSYEQLVTDITNYIIYPLERN